MAEFLFSLTKNDILFKIQYIIFNNEADFNSEPNKPNKINEPNELTIFLLYMTTQGSLDFDNINQY